MIGQNNFKFVPLYGKADAICFQQPYLTLSKTTTKDAENWHFFSFITQTSSTAKLLLPSSS